jgi:hypothetical protein
MAGPLEGDDPVPISVKLYFNDTTAGSMTPIPLDGEGVESQTLLGRPSALIQTPFGRWATADAKMPLSVYGAFTCILWVESQQGAKNAYFVVEVYRESTKLHTYNTTKKDITATPTRFDIFDILNVEVRSGEALFVMVYFYADLTTSFPPQPSQANFLYGGGEYTSGISITTVPMTIEIIEPEVEKDIEYISFRAKVMEAFDVDPNAMNVTMTITPPKDGEVKSLGKVEGLKTADGILYNVEWEYLKDKKAKSGEYTITLEASYDGTQVFTNTSKFTIEVPKRSVTDISQTPKEPFIIIGVVVLIIVVVLIGYKKGLFKRRAPKAMKRGVPAKKEAPVKKKATEKKQAPAKKEVQRTGTAPKGRSKREEAIEVEEEEEDDQ